MKSLKTIAVKTFALAMIIGMAAGCASVTDATIAEPEATTIDQPLPEVQGIGEEAQPILRRPTD